MDLPKMGVKNLVHLMYNALLKRKILEFLDANQFAIFNQIVTHIKYVDNRIVKKCLSELLSENAVDSIIFKGFKLYFLSKEQKNIIKRINNIKMYVLTSIERYGPIRPKKIAQSVNRDYGLNVSLYLIYKIVRTLLKENLVGAKRTGKGFFYYQKGNVPLEERLLEEERIRIKKRTIKSNSDLFVKKILKNTQFKKTEIDKIQAIRSKIEPVASTLDLKGRSHAKAISVIYLLHIRKQLYNLTQKNEVKLKDLLFWLRLHEIVLDLTLNSLPRPGLRTYHFYIKQILDNKQFCNPNDRSHILNTPNYKLRICFMLTKFTENSELIAETLSFLEKFVEKGYSVDGKDIKGVAGGLICGYRKKFHLKLALREISDRLNIAEPTIRKRRDEFCEIVVRNKQHFPEFDIEGDEKTSKERNKKSLSRR